MGETGAERASQRPGRGHAADVHGQLHRRHPRHRQLGVEHGRREGIGDEEQRDGVDRFVVGEGEPARHLTVAGRLPVRNPLSLGRIRTRSRSKIAGNGPSVGDGGVAAVLVARQIDRGLER